MADLSAYIQTASGRKFHILDPDPSEVYIEDIAHHLAQVNRFAGACRHPYSVAQHSVLVSRRCSKANKLWGLLHDSAEAYVHDITRPLKHSGALPGYHAIEEAIIVAVAVRFGLSQPRPKEIKEVDERMCITERRDLLKYRSDDWTKWVTGEAYEEPIRRWNWKTARDEFLYQFEFLTGG